MALRIHVPAGAQTCWQLASLEDEAGPFAEEGFMEEDIWKAGGRVGRYELEKELGRGGMGVVYLGTDVESGRKVAIKTLLSMASDSARKRFLREGEAQAKADAHPNVLRIRAAGEAGDRPYLVMDFAPGGDLAGRVKKGPLPPLEATRIARDLARGLAHVHARGILHRDLKPANVLFSEDGNPQLVDFGLARLEGAERLTATGAFLGTPAYMAPEQTGGDTVDVRADVYGLGAILYQMLAGRVPFEGAGAEVITKVITEAPTSTRAFVPGVPEALDRIALRCLAKDRQQRYASAESLAQELDKALAGAAAGAEGGRRRTMLLLAVSLVVIGLVFAATWWRVQRGEPPSASPAEGPVAGPPVARATPAPSPMARDPLESTTWGLPAKGSKRFGLHWFDQAPSNAIRNIDATLELGPAVGPDSGGVVRCPGKLSALFIKAGAGHSEIGSKYDFGDATLDLAITITLAHFVRVEGLDEGHKQALLESVPENLRWARNPETFAEDRSAAWTGSILMNMLTNELLEKVLSVSLPRVGQAQHRLPLRPLQGQGAYACKPTMRDWILLYCMFDQVVSKATFEGTWRLDAEGALESAKVTEFSAASHSDVRHDEGRVTWSLGPPGSFPESRKP
jgi:hypothetical protein